MHLIFIRHCDPDYKKDSLTEKGWREAELLSRRVSKWSVTQAFTSPFGRARDTAKKALEELQIEPDVCPWLREFNYPVKDPKTGAERHCWDFLPDWLSAGEQRILYDKDEWKNAPVMQSGNIAFFYKTVCDGIDCVLASYNYKRQGGFYMTDRKKGQPDFLITSSESYKTSFDDRTLVFFCHLGVMFAIIGHLLNTSPVPLWQGFFVAPSSVTVLSSEERTPCIAQWRAQTVGDTTHLHDGKETPSSSGYFTDVFKG